MTRHSALQRRWIVSGLLVLLAALTVVSGASAADPPMCRVVNQTQRTHYPTDRGQSLSNAIAEAAPDDELTVTGTCTGTYTLDKSLSLTGLVTRRFPMPTLNGGQAGSTLTVEEDVTATLTNLTLTGGTGRSSILAPDHDGGGLYNAGTVTLVHVNVVENSARNGRGGGILNTNTGTIVLEGQCVVSGNSAEDGGGIHNAGTATARGSSIVSGNSAEDGGGIYSFGTLTVDGSSITGNSALFRGGGIFKGVGTATLRSATVSNNTVMFDGAGIFSGGGTMVLDSSTVSGNTGSGAGGGIHHGAGALTLTMTTLSKNMSGTGGGVYSSGANTTVTVTASSVNGNTSFTNGGGVYVDSGTVNLQSASTVTGNTAFDNGGGIYNDAGLVNLGDTTVSGNTPDNCVGVAGC